MGLFSRSKKNSNAPTSAGTSVKTTPTQATNLDPRVVNQLKKHPTGFYKSAQKGASGAPIASKVYWNTIPPTPCPDIQ